MQAISAVAHYCGTIVRLWEEMGCTAEAIAENCRRVLLIINALSVNLSSHFLSAHYHSAE
jgi:hypothetical protein